MLPRRDADLDASDPFLPLVLGVVSLARRLDAVLDVIPQAPASLDPQPGTSPVPEDDATIHLLLGIISVRRGLSSHLRSASAGDSAGAVIAGRDDRSSTGDVHSTSRDVRGSAPLRALLR